MKKVCYIFRDPRIGNYSIEELFKRIIDGFKDKIENFQYTCKTSRIKTLLQIIQLKADIFHITGDVNYVAWATPANKTLLTVHDIGHYENTLQGIKKEVYKKVWLDLPLRKVRHITAISYFTKERICRNIKINPEKITVIHNPKPDFAYTTYPEIKDKFCILQIGSGRNKNLNNLIDAIRDLPDVRLILLRRYDLRLEKRLQELKIDFEFKSNVTYNEVEKIYAMSHALFFASEYEGFGMPILEAQCVGRPVITSNCTAMPEIAGNGALYVDPKSVIDIKKAVQSLMLNEELRKMLILNGLENVKRFSFEKILSQYLNLYNAYFD